MPGWSKPLRIECQHGFDYEQDGVYCPLCTHGQQTVPSIPSARSLGISRKHRNALMREGIFKHYRELTISNAADPWSPASSVERFHEQAMEYLTRRAKGESRLSIITDFYGKGTG